MLLSQRKTQALLKRYSIKIPTTKLFHDKIPSNISYPAVLKIDSEKVIHKTDMGLVKTEIIDKKALDKTVREFKNILKKRKIVGYDFVLQEQISGTELIVGMKRDEVFGPVIMLGLGGIYVEIFKDVTMGIAPLSKNDCYQMIESLSSKKLFEGYRNLPKIGREKILQFLQKFSDLSMENDNISEIDFNPVFITRKGLVVADARVIIKDA